MRWLCGAGVLACALSAFAAVDGIVVNRTTGAPQAAATVTLYKLGQNGMESIESVKSDAAGKFSINQTLAPGPHLVQAVHQGVIYNKILPPGTPSTGLQVDVYNAVLQPGGAKVAQHFILFEPSGTEMAVTESIVYQNDGKTTFNDPNRGTLRIYVPEAGFKSLTVNATAPSSVPVRKAAEKTSEPNVYKIDFAIKPGESNVQLNYSVPFTSPGAFEGRNLTGAPASLIAPDGVTLKGDGLEPRGQEPRTKASIYQMKAGSFKVEISGTGSLRQARSSEPEGESGPQVTTVLPKIYAKLYWILGLGLGILALGFILLYRAHQPVRAEAANPQVRKKGKK